MFFPRDIWLKAQSLERWLGQNMFTSWHQARNTLRKLLHSNGNGNLSHLLDSKELAALFGGNGDSLVSQLNEMKTNGYVEKLLKQKEHRKYILFNPGPVLTTPQVKNALIQHDICHRDEDFSEVMTRTQERLLKVFKASSANHSAIVIPGSGTSGIEAVFSSCFSPDSKILIVSNGGFGERLREVAELHKLNTVSLKYKWDEFVETSQIEDCLKADADITAVAMVHHETSVGMLNPIHDVGKIAKQYDCLFVVDCISSLGGEYLDMERDQIDICVASSNKCLQAISGLALLCINNRVWERIADIEPRVFCLDLKKYQWYAKELKQTPFTPSVALFFALDRALAEILEEGVENRIARYREMNQILRDGMKRLGLEIVNEHERSSHTISSIRVPEYLTFSELYRRMKNLGFIIYDSKAHLEGKVFQVANMGDLHRSMVYDFLVNLEDQLTQLKEEHYRRKVQPQEASSLP